MNRKAGLFLVATFLGITAAVPLPLRGVQGRFIVDGPAPPNSLLEMTSKVQTIIEATVIAVYPATTNQSGILGTDSLLQVISAVKGVVPMQVVVRQIGGTAAGRTDHPMQYKLMQPGERYILFLINPTDEARARMLPVRQGAPRYEMLGHVGVIRLDGGKVVVSSDLPTAFRKSLENLTPTQLVREINSLIATP